MIQGFLFLLLPPFEALADLARRTPGPLHLSRCHNSSGAAVVDCRGRLLRIVTSGPSRIAGLAISVSSVNRVMGALLEKGYVPSNCLGIGVQPAAIPGAPRTSLSGTCKAGVIVVKVEPRGPADQAGGLLGDILVGFGMAHVGARSELFIYAHEENAQPVSD